MATTDKTFVAYLRVSTQKQGQSGLGLEAQRSAVEAFGRQQGGQIQATFVEVERGKCSDRPQLENALQATRKAKGTLLIAKLDRLARNAAFIANLMDASVEFVAIDQPYASRLTLHILAAVAEDEARRTSERTKAALAAARSRGVKLGSPIATKTVAQARAARSRYAAQASVGTRQVIADIQSNGITSFAGIARALQARGIRTPRGQTDWQAVQVSRLLAANRVTN